MNVPLFNGYLLVSEKNSNTLYRGVDRVPWDYIGGGYYAKSLPTNLNHIYEALRKGNSQSLWWPTSTNLADTVLLQEFSTTAGVGTELLGVFSPYLAEALGRDAWEEPAADLLGVDVVSIGEWSLLRSLLESPMAGKVMGLVNGHGLLPDTAGIEVIDRMYKKFAAENIVEPIAGSGSGLAVEPVTVFLMPAAVT